MKQDKIENFLSTRYKKRIYTPSLSISKKSLVKNYSYRSSTTPKYILTYKFLSKNKNSNTTERAKVVVSKNNSEDREHNNLYLSELNNKVNRIERKIKQLQQEIKKDCFDIVPKLVQSQTIKAKNDNKKISLTKNNSFCFHKIKNLVYKSKSPCKLNCSTSYGSESNLKSLSQIRERCYNILERYTNIIQLIQKKT